ncbi:MAG: nucleotide exchange factor GrpE [Nanoarchaeota archaeon]|nr:nucleotide exchange factor GrpE [Nanoarchaeota archaeon]
MKKSKKQSTEAKKQDLIEDVKRIQADFVNFKARVEKEKEAYSNYKIEGFVVNLLDVIDNMELALKVVDDEGVKLVHKQFLDVLEKNGVKKISENDEFDPEKHEAVEKIEGKENKIMEIVQNGFTFNDKIIRASKVKVGGKE